MVIPQSGTVAPVCDRRLSPLIERRYNELLSLYFANIGWPANFS